MVTVPPRSRVPVGFGPHASPQSPMLHEVVSGDALHGPANEIGASARAKGAAMTPTRDKSVSRVPDRMAVLTLPSGGTGGERGDRLSRTFHDPREPQRDQLSEQASCDPTLGALPSPESCATCSGSGPF